MLCELLNMIFSCFEAGAKDEDCGAEADMQQARRRRSKPPSLPFHCK